MMRTDPYGQPICVRCGGVLPGSCVCDLPALGSLQRAMDENCSCRGEAHDECRPEVGQ